MSMPYRLFFRFYQRTIHGSDAANSFLTLDKWTVEHLETNELGHQGASSPYERWDLLVKGYEEDGFLSQVGLDALCKVRIELTFDPPWWTSGSPVNMTPNHSICDSLTTPKEWDEGLVTGRHYDGSNIWENYPINTFICPLLGPFAIPTVPTAKTIYIPAYYLAAQMTYVHEDAWWRGGLILWLGTDDSMRMNVHVHSMKASYFNSVVNSLSRYSCTTAGGVPLVLTGLGFLGDDGEIEEGGGELIPGPWEDFNTYIYFEGLEGQGTYTLDTAFDFTNDSNTQITIPALPAMLAGHYQIRLKKINHGSTRPSIESYAGDWRCDTDGRVYEGTRIIFTVTEPGEEDGDGDIYITSEWKWKSRTGEIFKYWAPIDTRTPLIFHDGRILSIGAFTRAIDDNTGMCQIGDLDIEIAQPDQEISKLLAEYTPLNQEVSIFWGYKSEPFSWRRYLCKMVVADYERPDASWKARLKDFNARYF